jgi:homoserine kinase
MVNLRVPASSANLGPGFDCLGLAVALYMRCQAEFADQLQISGCPAAYQNADNLVYRAYGQAARTLGYQPRALRLHIESEVPFSHGLGSSAAAIVAGAAAAFCLHGVALDREVLLNIAAAMEGHPDNVAASVYGGLRASMREGDGFVSVPFPISAALRMTALVPPFELATKTARAALPQQVALADVVHNLSHSLVLLKALETGDMPLLTRCLQDKLHQPYRLPMMQGAGAVWEAAALQGAAVYLSGAGPTLMCLHLTEDFPSRMAAVLPEGWRCMPLAVDWQGVVLA